MRLHLVVSFFLSNFAPELKQYEYGKRAIRTDWQQDSG